MSNHDTPSTQALIERYYQEERDQKLREQTLADINLKVESTDLALLTVLSKRFNKSREEVLKDLTASALNDLFSAIDANERKLLARDADDQARSIAEAIAEDNGLKEIESKPNFWAQIDKTLVRQEKKRLKELQQQASQSSQSSSMPQPEVMPEENSSELAQSQEAPLEPAQTNETSAIEAAPKAVESQAEAVPSMSVFSE